MVSIWTCIHSTTLIRLTTPSVVFVTCSLKKEVSVLSFDSLCYDEEYPWKMYTDIFHGNDNKIIKFPSEPILYYCSPSRNPLIHWFKIEEARLRYCFEKLPKSVLLEPAAKIEAVFTFLIAVTSHWVRVSCRNVLSGRKFHRIILLAYDEVSFQASHPPIRAIFQLLRLYEDNLNVYFRESVRTFSYPRSHWRQAAKPPSGGRSVTPATQFIYDLPRMYEKESVEHA